MSVPSRFEAPSPDALSALMPAFDFEHLIAANEDGAVYKATQKSLDRPVAIKILPREREADPIFRQSFDAAAKAMARLNHPNLIAVYDSGEVEGMGYIVMEFVPGKSLSRSAYGKKIDPAQAVELAIGISKGLAHAHSNGILHRNLTPGNILLNQNAEPKIGDFGVIHATVADGPEASAGTPGYTPPELSRAGVHADARSDQYAAGVILYELLTGSRQRPGSPPPSAVCAVDAGMDRIWQRATNADPAQRYENCDAFAADLQKWLKGSPATGAAAPAPARPVSPPRPPERSDDPIPAKRSGGMAVNLLLMAILAGGGYFAWDYFSKNSTATPTVQTEGAKPPATPANGGSAATRSGDAPSGDSIPAPTPGSGARNRPAGDTAKTPSTSKPPASDELTPKAKELIAAAEKDRAKALGENVKKFVWDLDGTLRGLSKNDLALWKPQVESLKQSVRDSRVPESIPEGGPIKASPAMARALTVAAARQREIDAEFLAKVTRYRDLYVPRLRTAIEEGEKGNFNVTALKERLENARNVSDWVRMLGGEAVPENPSIGERPSPDVFGTPEANPFGTPITE
jgi:serine/threonine protein kinase